MFQMLKKYTQKNLEKRKEERKDFPDFFQKHIEAARGKYCEECGDKLKGNVTEIAHILPKQTFKSISTNDKNVLYLCGLYSKNNCHSNMDNYSNEKFKEMLVYPKISCIFEELEKEITEKISFKIYDKYTD